MHYLCHINLQKAMKIALIGYGKMGHAIEKFALERGHEIVSIIDIDNQCDFDSAQFKSADVAIEFTTPATAYDNCLRALQAGVKVVSGSTGWTDRIPQLKNEMAGTPSATFFYSSNYSLGVNIFFAVNKYLARLMNGFAQYDVEMKEIHHIHKLDHPSGTAITLANGIIENLNRKKAWTENEEHKADEILIEHERIGEVPGTHIIRYKSPVDEISITHEAFSRDGFALGAVVAAEWLCDKTGFLGMDDMLKF